MRPKLAALHVFAAILVYVSFPRPVEAQQLHIWVKAFIPNAHPSRPAYVRKLASDPPRWAIPGPTIPWSNVNIPVLFDTCFLTDNRTFSSDPNASARVTSEAVLTYDARTVRIGGANGRALHRADFSHEVDCDSGKEKASSRAETSGMAFGAPAVADGVVQVVLSAQARNPLAPRFGTPAIDFGGAFTWDVRKRTLRFQGYAGTFPAFEAYARLNNGKVVRLFNLLPKDGASTWHLYDVGLGVNTRNFIAEVDLPENGDAAARLQRITPVLAKQQLERELFTSNGMFQQTNDPEQVLVVAAANSAYKKGLSEADTAALVNKVRDSIQNDKQKMAPYGLDLGLTTLERIRRASSSLLKSNVLAGLDLETSLRQHIDSWSQKPDDYNTNPGFTLRSTVDPTSGLTAFQRAVLGEAFDNYNGAAGLSFRSVYDKHLQHDLLVTPDKVESELRRRSPQFADQPAVQKFLSLVAGSRDADGNVVVGDAIGAGANTLFRESMSGIAPVIGRNVKKLADGDYSRKDASEVALAALGDAAGFDVRRAVGAARALEDGVSLGNAAAGIYLASTLVGLFDARTARDIERVGNAAILIANAISASSASDGTQTAMAGGTAAVTGNYIGAALALFSVLADSQRDGSSPEAIILEQISELRKQLDSVRVEMHQRFDRVDAKLDIILASMMTEFGRIETELSDMKLDLEAIRSSLSDLNEKLSYVDLHLSDAISRLGARMEQLALSPCLSWRDTTVTIPMPGSTFVTCLSQLASLATQGHDRTWQFDPQSIQNILGSDATPQDRVPYLIMASTRLGHPFVSPGQLDKVSSPADWISAASSYVRVAQTWPDHYRGTPIRQVKEILDRGKLIQNAFAAASRPDIGGRLLQTLLSEYQTSIDELGPQITNALGQLALEGDSIKAGEKWADVVEACPTHFFRHYPASEPKRPLPGTPRAVPPDGRVAQRLSVGGFEWCLAFDNIDGKGTAKPYEALLIGRLKLASDNYLSVYRRYLRTTDSPVHPKLHLPGGIACCYWEPDLESFLRTQWAKLLPQLELPQTEDSARGELATNIKEYEFWLRPYPDQTERFSSLLRQASSDRIYQLLESDASLAGTIARFETTSLLIRAFAELSLSTEVRGNDALHALVGSSAGLFGRNAIASSKANHVSGFDLARAGARRGQAASQLIERAFQSRAENPPEPTSLERTISLVEHFYEGQVTLCREGRKPMAACGGS